MAYDSLKTVANQVAGQTNQGLASFLPQSMPIQTDVITKMLPLGGPSWKNGWRPRTPAEIQSNKESMMNTYNNMRQDGFSSNEIASRLNAGGVYTNLEKGIGSQAFQISISSGIKAPEPNGPTRQQQRQLNWATRQAARQERQQERQNKRDQQRDAQEKWEGSAEGQAALNNVPSGTGNTTVDAFNAFSAIKDAPAYSKDSGVNFMSSKAGLGISGAANAAASVVGGLADAGVSFDVRLGNYNDRPAAQQLNETQEAVRQGIYSGVSAIPMFGPLISAGLQLTDGLGKMLGTQMSNISKDAAEDVGISRGLNNVIATIPGVGSLLGAFTKKTDEFEVDMDKLAGVGSAYDMSTFDSAEDLSGGLFLGQRNKVNDFIAEQNRLRDTMTGISDTQRIRKEGASAAAADLAQQNKNRYAGITGGSMAIGKKGMKLKLDNSRALLQRFQKGGKLGTPGLESNVIVEGAYHAHKNHLDEVNPELSDMTPKGIPVATEDASGNKTQVAEIEVGELILTKDLTDKLEKLYKDGSDEAAIEAGMLFTNEIIDNTVDNKGGVLNEDN